MRMMSGVAAPSLEPSGTLKGFVFSLRQPSGFGYLSLRLKAKYAGLLRAPSSREKTGQPACPLVQS